jgi:hypothetical protein
MWKMTCDKTYAVLCRYEKVSLVSKVWQRLQESKKESWTEVWNSERGNTGGKEDIDKQTVSLLYPHISATKSRRMALRFSTEG